jgi:hypothetical protein
MIKTLRVDDILIIVATVRHISSHLVHLCLCAQFLAACQTAIVFNACEHGLGQHFEVLSSSDRETFFKVTPDNIRDNKQTCKLIHPRTEPICDKHDAHRLTSVL